MPDLVGTNAAVAKDRLKKLGFTKITFGSGDPVHSVVLLPSNWTVIKQSARPGEQVESDRLIVLTVAKAPN